jgi:VanZ family protein
MKYAPTLIVSILILIAVLIPGPNVPSVGIAGFDKFVHFGMFGTWAVAVRYDFNGRFRFWVAFSLGLGFSLFTEIIQVFAEARTFDWYDIVADVVGLLAGLAISAYLLRLFKLLPK